MKDIVSIGFSIPVDQQRYIDIDSFSSLSDVDIAIFSPSLRKTDYSTYEESSWEMKSGSYQGKPLYNKDSSALMLEHSKHWNLELMNFVKSGKTLFVLLPSKSSFFVYTGTKDISGTGRNQKTTDHVQEFSNYSFLPFKKMEFKIATGKTIVPCDNIFINFYNQFKDYMSFEVYIDSENTQACFTSKNKDRILGARNPIQLGHVVFIPNLNFHSEKLYNYNEDTDEKNWNKEGLKLGKIFINSLIEIDSAIRQKDIKTPKPDWANEESFSIQESEKVKKIIAENLKEIERKNDENSSLYSVLEEHESLKDLLFETGKPLELSVIKALTILGFHAENYDDGTLELDQVITSPEKVRYIGECEGKDSKDIDISKFRQLMDSLSEDFEHEEVDEKAIGLLFGNPQRLEHPSNRTLDFTKKCLSGAKRENIGLIKTADLYEITRYLLENSNEDFRTNCRKEIHNQLGGIVVFPKIPV